MPFVTRRGWTITTANGPHRVELADEYWLGERVVTVDGTVAYRGRSVLSDHSGEYPFLIGRSPAILRITTNGLTYKYEVTLVASDPTGVPRDPVRPGMIFAAGIVFVVLSLPLLAFFGVQLFRELELAVDPRTADGILQTKRILGGRTSSGYELQYVFVAESGALVTGRDTVSQSSWDNARPGSHYRVKYAAADPEVNRITEKTALNAAPAAFIVVVNGTCFAMGVVGIRRARRMTQIARRLAQGGTLARATVTRVSRPRYARGVGVTVVLVYGYADETGTTRTGAGRSTSATRWLGPWVARRGSAMTPTIRTTASGSVRLGPRRCLVPNSTRPARASTDMESAVR